MVCVFIRREILRLSSALLVSAGGQRTQNCRTTPGVEQSKFAHLFTGTAYNSCCHHFYCCRRRCCCYPSSSSSVVDGLLLPDASCRSTRGHGGIMIAKGDKKGRCWYCCFACLRRTEMWFLYAAAPPFPPGPCHVPNSFLFGARPLYSAAMKRKGKHSSIQARRSWSPCHGVWYGKHVGSRRVCVCVCRKAKISYKR